MISFFHRKILLPLNDAISGLKIYKDLSFLEESQWWPEEKHKEYQLGCLKNLVKHIFANVPFYRNWSSERKLTPLDFNLISDLNKLPVISKNDIRKNPRLFIADNQQNHKYLTLNSSGSTGEPFQYLLSREAYSMKYAAAIRGWYWMDYKLGDFYAKLSQNKRASLIKKTQDLFNRCLYLYIPDLSVNTLQNVIKRIENEKPEFIRCYPDPLLFIARILKSKERKLNGIKAINCTGNILTDESRKIIEEQFNCKVFDSYSCEGSAVFFEGPNHDSLLGSMEYAITEVIDSDRKEVNAGNPGMHITTDLWNYSMPLVRYNTQDMVVKSNTGSSCGRQLFRIEKVIGRDNDILVTPSGNLLIVHLFTIYFEYYESIIQFQIEQLSADEFVFRLVVNDTFTNEILQQINNYWKNFLGCDVKLNIEIHNTIPNTYSGKRRFLIRNPQIKLPF